MTLLVDTNNILAMATHVGLSLTSASGFPTGGLYGTMRKIKQVLSDVDEATRIVCVMDGGKPAERQELLPEYKGNRNKGKGEDDPFLVAYKKQRKRVAGVLLPLGVTVVRADGFEADDVIAGYVQYSGETCVIVSGDKDMLQLAHGGTTVYRPTQQDIVKRPYKGYLLARCLQGDNSDNIPGVGQIGEKRAEEIIAEMKAAGAKKFTPQSLILHYEGRWAYRFHAPTGAKKDAVAKAEQTCDNLRRNWKLMNLRRYAEAAYAAREEQHTGVDEDAFAKVCRTYNLESMSQYAPQFLRPFYRVETRREKSRKPVR